MIDMASLNKFASSGEKTRKYIGASGIANECMAYHQLCMRGFPSDAPSPQLIRIFADGHEIETKVIDLLRAAGHEVQSHDARCKQFSGQSHGGHHRANLDGFIRLSGSSEMMTLEIKSMNRDMFKKFQKVGLALSHPEYYSQVQDGLCLTRNTTATSKCYVIAYCKDNSQLHAEIIEYDPVHAGVLMAKVGGVVGGLSTRKGSHRNEYDCQQCFKRTSCWEPDVSKEPMHCSLCKHSAPIASGGSDKRLWRCVLRQLPNVGAVCPSFELYRPEKKS